MSDKDTAGYLGAYGGIILPKAWCAACECFSFVKRGLVLCCDSRIEGKPERWKRESLASGLRQLPSKEYQTAQLVRQADRCFYCFMHFGSWVLWRNKDQRLIIHWDHYVPFAYLQTNPTEDFVAACQICNAVKHAKLFQTVQEARQYVSLQRTLAT